MGSPILATMSVRADVSKFSQAELDAFVALNKRTRPASWALVERLQQACRAEAPATAVGLQRSKGALSERTAA